MRPALALLLSVFSFATLSPALAEAKLVQSSPAAGATATAPRNIKLTFSEKIDPASAAELSMGDGMGVPTKSTVSDDGKTLTIRPTAPFMAGKWTLSWHTTAADGQKSQGSFNFTIK